MKGMVQENRRMCKSSNDSLWNKVLEAQAMRKRQGLKQSIKRLVPNGGHRRCRTRTTILMKRRAGSRRPVNGIVSRVRILKRLVPNGKSMGLDGLFRETA
ncbi:hypothetical protein L1049_016534 [Liquidambar formosana]|uniref:Uncharacterized protein n=1 Tax=Liquidambar formosana TaxID=63359 RepID=A0AAP0S008_LIQFO